MTNGRFNLLMIRSSNIDAAVRFYQRIGLTFAKHSHGKGPDHYCSENGGILFEIYPLEEGKPPTLETRLGFCVPSVDAMASALVNLGARVISAPKDSPWGRRAVFADFDGHRVEFTSLFVESPETIETTNEFELVR